MPFNIEEGRDMKLFLTKEQKQDFYYLKHLEKTHVRKLSNEELEKIEYVEQFRDQRRVYIFSIFSLFVSIMSFIFVIVSRL